MIPFPSLMSAYLTTRNRALLATLSSKVNEINKFADYYRRADDEDLLNDFNQIKKLARDAVKPDVVEAQLFAIIREFAHRTLGMYPYDVQLLAALALRRGNIIQMETGEGKTLVAPFHAVIEVVYGRRTVVVAPNDYLSSRDATWMGPLYQALGVSVATVQAWYSPEEKRRAYGAEVVYISTDRFVFDYLFRQHALSDALDFPLPQETVIIDEIDNVLLDQALKPFALVSPINFKSAIFATVDSFVGHFVHEQDFQATPKVKSITFSGSGYQKAALLAAQSQMSLPELMFYLESALSAHYLYEREKDYFIEQNKLVVVDSFSGLPIHSSSFAYGVQQAIEQKEGLPLSYPSTIINQISLQSFFSSFSRIAGMSGSAVYNVIEFRMIYKLDVVPIPPNQRSIRADDEDLIFKTKQEQWQATREETERLIAARRPVLISTTTIDDAQAISDLLKAQGVAHALLTAKNYFEEAPIIARAGEAGRVTVAALMAGRGVDIRLDDEAFEAGGLHVIGVGRNEDRRLDEQLKGRAGRQGDPGSSIFILSLEDDLLKALGVARSKALIERINPEPGEPIVSPLVNRTLKNAQRRLVLLRFYQRRTALLFDEYLNRTRQSVFSRRNSIYQSASYDYDIDRMFDRYVARLMRQQNLSDRLHDIGDQLELRLSPQLWNLLENDKQAFVDTLQAQLYDEYDRRRARVGDQAAARERLILLRCIDYSWSLYIEYTQNIFDSLTFPGSQRSRLEVVNEISRKLLGANEKIFDEIDQISIFYLMHIHDNRVLQEIKYWRGMGISYSGKSVDSLDDGITPPDDYLAIYRSDQPEYLLPGAATNGHPPLLLPGRERAERTLSEHIQSYLADLRIRGDRSSDIGRIKAVLEQFAAFASGTSANLKQAFDKLPEYLRSLQAQGISFRNRARQRKVVLDFFKSLQKRNLLVIGGAALHRRRFTERVAHIFSNPLFILQIALVLLAFAAYRALSALPIPFLSQSELPNPFLHLPVPPLFLQLVDDLLTADALLDLRLGLLGVIPFLATRLLSRIFGQIWQFESPVVYLPAIIAGSAGCTIFLALSAGPGRAPLWYQDIIIFGAILLVAALVTCLAWIIQYTEFINGMQLIILGNALIALSRAWSARILPNVALSSPIWLIFIVVVPLVFVLYGKLSRVSLDIVRVGRFDLKSGELRNTPATVFLDTIFDGYHYLFAFVIVSFIAYWIYRLSIVAPGIYTRYLGFLSANYWQPVVYLLLVFWIIHRRIVYRYSEENIKSFLQNSDSFIRGARQWQDSIGALRARVNRIMMVDFFFEIVIVVCLVDLFLALDLAKYGLEYLVYVIMLVEVGISLLLFLFRRISVYFSDYAPYSLLLTPPPTQEHEERAWIVRQYYSIKQKHGIIGFLVFIAGVIQFFDYLLKLVAWMWSLLHGGAS